MRVAIIGLGKQNLSDHVPALLRRKDIEIAALCDPFEGSYETFKGLYPEIAKTAKYFQDYKDLPLSDIDFCIVSVPHDQYKDVVELLCKNNVYFMKEKPLARNLSEAQEFEKVEGFTKYCFVCTQRRFNSLYIKAKDTITKTGTPFLFNATYKLNIGDPAEGWRGSTEIAGGGCVLDMGYHIIDQLVWWFGKPDFVASAISSLANEKVAGQYAEDTASILFRYNSGLHGTITLSRSAGEKFEKYSLHGSRAHIEGDKKNLRIKSSNGEVMEEMSIDNDSEMMDAQLDYFISKMKDGSGFENVHEANLKNMEFIAEIYEAAKTN